MIRTGLIGLAALAAAGVMAAEADVERLDAAQALWQAAAADDYRYAYEKYCECYRDAQPQTVVTVTDGAIERVHHLHEDSDREVPGLPIHFNGLFMPERGNSFCHHPRKSLKLI
jgi:hypothetical protein